MKKALIIADVFCKGVGSASVRDYTGNRTGTEKIFTEGTE